MRCRRPTRSRYAVTLPLARLNNPRRTRQRRLLHRKATQGRAGILITAGAELAVMGRRAEHGELLQRCGRKPDNCTDETCLIKAV